MADIADLVSELEELRTELRKKEENLMLAARYGKELLEKNISLEQKLTSTSEKCSNLEADLQAQSHEAQRLRASLEKVAENHVSDLEHQLDALKQELETERSNFMSAIDEHKREAELWRAENKYLKTQLEQASTIGKPVLQSKSSNNTRLQLCEDQKQMLHLENEELQKQVEKFQAAYKTCSQEVSTLAHTCDRLSDELVSSRAHCSAWEQEMLSKEEELASRFREIQEVQEINRKLQSQLDQQGSLMTPKSTTSGASLFEELTLSHNSLAIPDDSLSNISETSDASGSDRPVTLCKVASHSGRSSPIVPTPGWSEECECLRCSELERTLSQRIKELKLANDQLLAAVTQKFELQQQVEAWQSDMDMLIQKQVNSQLKKEGRSKKKAPQLKAKAPERATLCIYKNLPYHVMKHSWLF